LGYDETPGTQTGSHNLLLDGTGKITSHYASIIDGGQNADSGFASTTIGGYANKITASYSTLTASYSTLTGGCSTLIGGCSTSSAAAQTSSASGTFSVSAVCTTSHPGYYASVTGGTGNQTSAENSTVSGGAYNLAGGYLRLLGHRR
jgi:trimeric autotransporter adhesin